MYAKLVTIEGQQASSMDEAIAQFRDRSVRAMKGEPGWRGAYLLVDREAGKGVAISLWESLEALEATERVAARFRETAARTSGAAEPARMEAFEVVVQEVP
jgi:heme-degrading monooxygenase HmoA